MIECQISRLDETCKIPAIYYSFHDSPYGSCLIAFVEDKNEERTVCHLVFAEDDKASKDEEEKRLRLKFPGAQFHQESRGTKELVNQIFHKDRPDNKTRVRVMLKGTEFQMNVWESLTTIPVGTLVTYEQVAQKLGKPKAARAVGGALKANQVGYLIPCHRVVCKTGCNKFSWGAQRKILMQEHEQKYVDKSGSSAQSLDGK